MAPDCGPCGSWESEVCAGDVEPVRVGLHAARWRVTPPNTACRRPPPFFGGRRPMLDVGTNIGSLSLVTMATIAVGDVHGNLAALNDVLDQIRDEAACTGRITGETVQCP